MNCKSFIRCVAVILMAGFGMAQAQDSAVFDAQQGAWRLYYKDVETEQWINKLYVQQNAIKPIVQSVVRWNGRQWRYEYRVGNQRGAKQTIDLFRIWGIPLVFPVPDLPLVTADPRMDPETEDKQHWAQLKVKRQFEGTVVKAPTGWSAGLRIDEKAGQTSFVWTPGLKDSDPDGVAPGSSQAGFTVLRPELPGVARAKLTGSTEEPWGLDNLPETPFWSQKIDEIQAQDYLLVPVLAPIIVVPTPYDGAELARRLKAHAQTWIKYGHASSATMDKLNRQFDVMIPALELSNKPGVRAAAIAMLIEIFTIQRGMNYWHASSDEERFDATPLPRPTTQGTSTTTPTQSLDRVAARALTFNLIYLLTRMELGR